MTPREIVNFIQCRRWPLTDEKTLQAAMAEELARAGVEASREVNLGDGDIIDFVIGDVGVEVKIKGQRRAIYRQCERYCQHEEIRSLVLATNAAMGMPSDINGRSILVASLGRGAL